MAEHRITSLDDPRLDPYRSLKQSNLTRCSGRFIAEGHRVVTRLIESQFPVESVLISEHRLQLLDRVPADNVETLRVPLEIASQLVGYSFHGGIVACGHRLPAPPVESLLQPVSTEADTQGEHCDLLVACPRMTDPDNLGGLIRLCAAFGVRGLLLGHGCCDPYSRRTLRVSMGHAFGLPIVECADLRADLLKLRARHNCRIVATALSDDALALSRCTRSQRTVVLFGNEADGLAAEWCELADQRVMIPMADGADSLNVTVAAGVFLHYLRFLASPTPPEN